MVTMTCKCGRTSKTFKRLKKSDFPDGWVTDCCEENRSEWDKEPVSPERAEALSKEMEVSEPVGVEPQAEPASEPQKEPAAEEPKEDKAKEPKEEPSEEKPAEEAPKKKSRGRRSRKES